MQLRLEWPIEMAGLGAGPEFQIMVQTQRALTLVCEAHEWAVLDKKFRDLPPLDPILGEMRMAWLNNGRESLVWSSCIASRQYCNGNQQFCQIVAQTMGLPSGACKPYVGQPPKIPVPDAHGREKPRKTVESCERTRMDAKDIGIVIDLELY